MHNLCERNMLKKRACHFRIPFTPSLQPFKCHHITADVVSALQRQRPLQHIAGHSTHHRVFTLSRTVSLFMIFLPISSLSSATTTLCRYPISITVTLSMGVTVHSAPISFAAASTRTATSHGDAF